MNWFLEILIFVGIVCLGLAISSLGVSAMYHAVEILPNSKIFLDIFLKSFEFLFGLCLFFIGIIVVIITCER